MDNQEIDILLKNQSLKFEFALRNLDLTEVFCYTPDDLARENRMLVYLLDWVEKYAGCRDRIRMEQEGYLFPPISPGISPENDWYRFKEWLHGRPLRTKLKEQLLRDYTPQIPEQLTDEVIALEVEKLLDLFAAISVQWIYRGNCRPGCYMRTCWNGWKLISIFWSMVCGILTAVAAIAPIVFNDRGVKWEAALAGARMKKRAGWC